MRLALLSLDVKGRGIVCFWPERLLGGTDMPSTDNTTDSPISVVVGHFVNAEARSLLEQDDILIAFQLKWSLSVAGLVACSKA